MGVRRAPLFVGFGRWFGVTAAVRFGAFRATGELLGAIVRLRFIVGGMRRELGAFAVAFTERKFGFDDGLTGRLVTVCGPFEVTGAEFDGALGGTAE